MLAESRGTAPFPPFPHVPLWRPHLSCFPQVSPHIHTWINPASKSRLQSVLETHPMAGHTLVPGPGDASLREPAATEQMVPGMAAGLVLLCPCHPLQAAPPAIVAGRLIS